MNGSNETFEDSTFGTFNNHLDIIHDVGYNSFLIYSIYNIVIDFVFILPTICGNVLILVAIGRFSGLRKARSSILIGNLAVSDLLVGLFVFPLDIFLRMRRDLFHLKLCLSFFSLVYACVGASVLNLFLLSLERFHAIVYPLKHAVVFTKRRIYVAILVVWFATLIVTFLPVFGLYHEPDPKTFVCGSGPLLYESYTSIIGTVIVLSLIVNCVLFFIIVRVAIRAASAFTGISRTEEEQKRFRKNIHHTRMMLVVSGLFIVFWGPFCIISLVPKPSPMVQFIRQWLSTLGLINSAINWIVYGVRSKKFRKAFTAILTCKCVSEKVEISSM